MLTATDDASNTLFSKRYQQTYHSVHGAVTESQHIFLQGAGVATRLQQGDATRVLEIGFGLGLNCLLTLDCALQNNTPLHYVSFEHDPISQDEFNSLEFSQLLKYPDVVDKLSSLFIGSTSSPRSLTLESGVSIDLHVSDATDTLQNVSGKFDAIYLDAFSPEVNPECWTEPFLSHLGSLLSDNGQLTSYCVKGDVKRALQSGGWLVSKFAGPKGKREVLRAVRS